MTAKKTAPVADQPKRKPRKPRKASVAVAATEISVPERFGVIGDGETRRDRRRAALNAQRLPAAGGAPAPDVAESKAK